MTNEQLRIALVANAVTRSNRIGFNFQDPAGKTLDEYTKEAMMQCVRVAQKMRQPGLDKELAGQVSPSTPSGTGLGRRSSMTSTRIFRNC